MAAAGTPLTTFNVGTISGVGMQVAGGGEIIVDEIRIADTYSDVVDAVLVPPAIPTGLTATPGANQVSLSWTATTGYPNSYNVKRSTVPGGPYTNIIGTTTAPTVSYTDSILGGTDLLLCGFGGQRGRGECRQFVRLRFADPHGPGYTRRPVGNPGRFAGFLKLVGQHLCHQLRREESRGHRRALCLHRHHGRSDVRRFRTQQRPDLLLCGGRDWRGRSEFRYFARERYTLRSIAPGAQH